MPYGHQVVTSFRRAEAHVLDKISHFSPTDLSDAMSKSGTVSPLIRPAFRVPDRVVGTALTISVPTGSQVIRAIGMDLAHSGDVVVFNGYGNVDYAMIGGNFGKSLKSRGVNAIVIDGAFRDLTEFEEMGLPVFSKGVATMSGPREGAGEVNVPIACGNVVINPGDIIVADNDGVVVVPQAHVEQIIELAKQVVANSDSIQASVNRGVVLRAEESLAAARAQGCDIQ